jgi:hypothetical protein
MFYPIWEAASLDEWLYNGGPQIKKGICFRHKANTFKKLLKLSKKFLTFFIP